MSYTDLTRDIKETVVTINNLEDAERALSAYVPASSHMTTKDTTLDRIRPLMQLLGNPQDRLKIVHVAGTSGKTSTAYYIAALLEAAGKEVGLTVSPHVDSITERIQLNGQPMAEPDFCREMGTFLELVRKAGQKPSYFELLYAFVLWVLTRQNIDYAVVETGLGGLYDATNVASRPDKVCVITDIGFDHQQLLGNTLTEIATQKAGIIHEYNAVFMYKQNQAVMEAIAQWTADHKAALHVVEKPSQEQGGDLPAYQQRNWNLAYRVYKYLQKRDNLQRLTSQELTRTQKIRIPGRMEIRQTNGKTLIMDGAHNAQKMTAFIDSFQRLYPDARPAVLLALKTGKEYQDVAPLLAPLVARVIVTTFNTSQDLPVRSMDPGQLAEAFRSAGAAEVKVIADSQAALQALLATPDNIRIITGSFYLLGQIRNNISL